MALPPTSAASAGADTQLALHQAADLDDVDALKAEILNGGDIESLTTGFRETPLHRASFAGAAGCVAELLRSRADVNAKRSGGFTALHLAQNEAVAKLLIEAGADREIRANNGKTPLEHCAGGIRVQEFISEHAGSPLEPQEVLHADDGPRSPNDMNDDMLRRARMTRKFTQLREKMVNGDSHDLDPDSNANAPNTREARDSSPQLDAWLREHVNAAGSVEPEPQPDIDIARDDDDGGGGGSGGDGSEYEYGSDEFEDYEDDEETCGEQQTNQGSEERLRPALEGAADLLRAAARGEVAQLQVGVDDNLVNGAPVSPDRDRPDPPPAIPVSQSSPSSSLSSPDHLPGGADPIAPLLAMLAQIRAVRGQTLAAVERLAPHMPEVVNIVAGLEEEAAGLQAAFDQLLQPLPDGRVAQMDRQHPRRNIQQDGFREPGVVAQLLQPHGVGFDDELDGQDGQEQEQEQEEQEQVAQEPRQAAAEPIVSIDILPSGFRIVEQPPVNNMSTISESDAQATPTAVVPAGTLPSADATTAAAFLPGGGQRLLIGGLDLVRDEAKRAQCSHVISVCTKEEFDLDAHVNPHGFSIPAFGHSFEHVVLELADSPLAGPLVDPQSGHFAPLLQPAFHAIDAWVAASSEWTVGGQSKHLMIHSVHGCSRPAAVLCAWMMAKGAAKVTLGDTLSAIRTYCGQPRAAPNFGFVAQLLEHEHVWATQRPQPSIPSVCIWEYVGLSEAEWLAELARSKQPGMLDRTSARRIMAISRRRQRLNEVQKFGTEESAAEKGGETQGTGLAVNAQNVASYGATGVHNINWADYEEVD